MSGPKPAKPKPVAPLESLEDARVFWRRRTLLTVTAFIATMLALAAAAPVKEVAVATGAIRSAAEVVVVEHSTGGSVEAVFAASDDEVAKEAPILTFSSTTLDAEILRLEIRQAHLSLRMTRLAALLDEAPYTSPEDPHLSAADRLTAERLIAAERADIASERAALTARLAESRAELAAHEATAIGARAELDAYRAQADMTASLAARQLSTRQSALETGARVAEAAARVAEAEGRIAAGAEAIAQIRAEKTRILARRRADWSRDLTEAAASVAETDAALREAYAKRDALSVTAPIAGRILEMGARAPGDVVGAGELIARIVPATDAGSVLIVEAWAAPSDIGHISIGDRAVIDVSAFDAELFGEIEGVVLSLSPSSIQDESGAPRFRVRLSLDRTEARVGDAMLRLAPGMLATARIVTAERTLFGYMAEPVTRALDVVFTER